MIKLLCSSSAVSYSGRNHANGDSVLISKQFDLAKAHAHEFNDLPFVELAYFATTKLWTMKTSAA
jgi:hypothetical protein